MRTKKVLGEPKKSARCVGISWAVWKTLVDPDEGASSQGSQHAKGAKEAKDLALGKAKMPRD